MNILHGVVAALTTDNLCPIRNSNQKLLIYKPNLLLLRYSDQRLISLNVFYKVRIKSCYHVIRAITYLHVRRFVSTRY